MTTTTKPAETGLWRHLLRREGQDAVLTVCKIPAGVFVVTARQKFGQSAHWVVTDSYAGLFYHEVLEPEARVDASLMRAVDWYEDRGVNISAVHLAAGADEAGRSAANLGLRVYRTPARASVVIGEPNTDGDGSNGGVGAPDEATATVSS